MLVASISGCVGQAHASTQSITISPTSVDQTINPGASFSSSFHVFNQGDTINSYQIYATPYSVSGETYNPEFTPISGATNITNWFSFAPSNGQLKPGDEQIIAYKITVPPEIKPGGYYGVLFAETKPSLPSAGVITLKRVGTVFYIRVAGPVTESGRVDSWQVPWLQRAPLTATVRLENNGATHYIAVIQVTMSGIMGDSKYQFNQPREILPQTIRRIVVQWPQGPSFGLFKVSGSVTYLGQSHTLPIHYVLVASRTLSWTLLGLLLLGIASLIFQLVRNRRNRHALPKRR